MNLLILSHQGLSFLEDLTRIARELNLNVSILSSRTALGSERVSKLQEMSDWLRVTDNPALTSQDVQNALDDLANDFEPVTACISVWEGYRPFMAEANKRLGAPDSLPEVVESLIDKKEMRRLLREAGLSAVQSEILTVENFEKVSGEASGPKFVKPRFGLGSFGARKMKSFSREHWVQLKSQMLNDLEYAGVFKSDDLIVEDYITGREFSFEVIVINGQANILAIHEKVEVDESGTAVLENACVSPPMTLTPAAEALGRSFVSSCLSAMNATQGCFHIEAKYDDVKNCWEILEMNPRVGGSLINRSVQAQTFGRVCLLTAWMRALVGDLKNQPIADSQPRRATFFRVFFGKSGEQISDIVANETTTTPMFSQIYVKPGAKLSTSAREIFLGQALWEMTGPEIIQTSRDYLKVVYG